MDQIPSPTTAQLIGDLESIAANEDANALPGLLQVFESQLQAYPEAINGQIIDNTTPLHVAAQLHLTNCVQLLLQYGANPNALTTEGNSPLHELIQGVLESDSVIQAARSLLMAGGNPNVTNQNGESVLYCALKGYPGIANLLLANGAIIDFGSALLLGDVDRVRQLLQESSDPQRLVQMWPSAGLDALVSSDHFSKTSLISASLLQLLFEYGFNPNWVDEFGRPLLLYALRYPDNPEVLDVILKAGGNPNAVHPTYPESALDLAIRDNKPGAIRVLKAAGAKTYAELNPA